MGEGFAIAFASMVFFGIYMAPRKFSGLRDLEFVLSMGAGVALTMLVAWILHRRGQADPIPTGALAYAFLCGPVWTLGIVFFTLSVTEMGLALATPIKNTTAVMGSLVGLVFFGETRHTAAWLALSGGALIVLCAVVIGRTGEGSAEHYTVSGRGTAFALLAAFFFAAYTYPLKAAMELGLDSYTIVLVMAAGTLASAALGEAVTQGSLRSWWTRPRADHLYAALSGSLWSLATLMMNAAIGRIGLAVTWPITNLNTVVAVTVGAVAFHEVRIEKEWKRLALGILLAMLGVLLLGLSKR